MRRVPARHGPLAWLRRPVRRATTALAVLALAGTALTATGTAAAAPQAWTPKPSPMTTPWTNQVPTDHPLPEYPRPQLTRPDWANLNGIWDFAVTPADAGQPASFTEQIRVPFVAESALSGIQRKITQNWSASTSRWSRNAGSTGPTGSACWSGRTCRPWTCAPPTARPASSGRPRTTA
ncbi:putative secreted protein [Streptomyces davaonensis JCM 4913]|uniref:Putative secreted protein n=1 Tax=Streptomyces davaonensis (strain DSM 101723 / JCM 4913 / KCC S-0913 / 768) TaxID=1214101 RepID=K4QW35_STRDJ|nr:putative secreted protein [Streptomyces davaonensis JCM 4913]